MIVGYVQQNKGASITMSQTQKWIFEPGHTAAQFSARHMMVSKVRGQFKNVEGSITINPEDATDVSVDVTIDVSQLYSGDKYRDQHLLTADFFDVENHPNITFKSTDVRYISQNDFLLAGDLTIRGVTHEVTLDVQDLGRWDTPFWEDGVDKGPITRAGFCAVAHVNRQDFGVSWNDKLDKGGVVVGDVVEITIDVEALLSLD